MEIKTIKLKHLSEFARQTLSDQKYKETAPISLIRAFAQSKNPLGDPDDTALVVAYDAGKCVGYHGLLPGYLYDGKSYSKIYWLVTFFVSPPYRGKGLGKHLVEDIQKTGIDLVTTGITKSAEGVYRTAGFKQLGELSYYQLRLDRYHLLDSFQKRKAAWVYRLAKRIFYSLVMRNLRPIEKKINYNVVEQLKPLSSSQVNMQSSYPAFPRNLHTVNWMLAHPWVVSKKMHQRMLETIIFPESMIFLKSLHLNSILCCLVFTFTSSC